MGSDSGRKRKREGTSEGSKGRVEGMRDVVNIIYKSLEELKTGILDSLGP